MPSEPAGASRRDVEKKLKELRDTPADTRSVKDAEIIPLHYYLMHAKPEQHWFCSKADPVAREAAVFLNRLFAYQNDKVTEWKARLVKVLGGCTDCVRSLDKAKEESKSTYFAAFTKAVLDNFWTVFEDFEAQASAQAIANVHLSDAQSSLVYFMLSKLAAFKNPAVLSALPSLASRKVVDDWPLDPPPAGLFLLALHEDKTIRGWARAWLLKGTASTKENFSGNHVLALKVMMNKLSPGNEKLPVKLIQELSSLFPFTDSMEEIWSALSSLLRIAPLDVIESFRVHRLVITHLHDDGSQFPEVLRCMVHCVKKLGNRIWEGESPEYPQVVFDSIKDNPSYSRMLLEMDSTQSKPWFLLFMLEVFGQIWEMPIFGEVFAKFIAFACEELRHERFGRNRCVAISAVAQVLSAALKKAFKSKKPTQKKIIADVLRIHLDLFVDVAFSVEYDKPHWAEARKQVIALFRTAMTADAESVACAILALYELQPASSANEIEAIAPIIQEDLWRKVYKSIRAQDQDGLAIVVGLTAKSVRTDKVSRVSRRIWKYYNGIKKEPPKEVLAAIDSVMTSIHSALRTTREGLHEAITQFANLNSTSELMKFLKREDMAQSLLFLLLSPVDELHASAQALIGQTFDVDMRSDCFRELFKYVPEASIRGLQDYMTKFSDYAAKALEACDLSKALVRCLTDIMDFLVGSPDALLKDAVFVKRYSKRGNSFTLEDELPKLWKGMTTVVSVIFKCTPRWSGYFNNNIMVEWMRDALIFARELLSQRRTFENAIIIASGKQQTYEGNQKLSEFGKTMVDNLQDVLLELQGWLRLTDSELLYQSFRLLKSLFECLKEADAKPSPDVVNKLQRIVDLKQKEESEAKKTTLLNPSDISELEVALNDFEKDHDDVETISIADTEGERDSSPGIMEISEVRLKHLEKAPAKSKKDKSVKQSKLPFSPTSEASSSKTKLAPSKPTKPGVSSHIRRDAKTGIKFEGKASARSVSSRSSAADETSSSSGSESDSGDEKGRRGLARLAAQQRPSPEKPKIRARIPKHGERRQIKFMDDPRTEAFNAMTERARKAEEARRNAMRLKPDISPLHRTILSWDYDHNGEVPPFKGEKPQLVRVPDRFKGHQHYQSVFEPLLLHECWAQITKSKEESASESYLCKISDRSHVDYWLDLELSTTEPVKPGWRLTPDTDVVLLRHPETKKSIMAKVTGFRNIITGIQITLRCCTMAHSSDPGLGTNAIWKLSQIFSLTTLHREFAALMGLPYYDMAELIYQPKLSDPVNISADEVQNAMKAYRLNEPQSKAILSSLKTEGFSLIQGPPGTGKTSTICGLVGAFLSSRKRAPTVITVGATDLTTPSSRSGKILICAPSNAAIDEVAKRLNDGVYGSQGQRLSPKVVRVGSDLSINVSAREISLDALVDKRMDGDDQINTNETSIEMSSLRNEIEEIRHARQRKQEEMNATTNDATKLLALEEEVKALNAKRIALSQKLDQLRDKQKSNARAADAQRRRVRLEVLAEADVVCSTLSGAGHEQLEPFDFDMIIIDEAAQAIELSSLIPLKYRSTQCIMVGDPQQLPPTVLSQEATKWGYNQSLFVRMQKDRPSAVHLLSIQYRMHPQISQLPSKAFYDGRLLDGPDMEEKTIQPWHSDSRFGVYKFFSVMKGRELASRVGHSLMNREECHVILALYERLKRRFPAVNFDYRIGIVTMYRAQVIELRRVFTSRFGADITGKIDFNTVDGFQGQEKDIIILSCVRAGASLSSVGFLADIRRMNVAITRARSSLFIVGHGPTLERSNDTWKGIVTDARSRSCYVELTDSSYFDKSGPSNAPKDDTSKTSSPKKAKATSVVNTQDSAAQLLTPKEMKMSRPKSRKDRDSTQEAQASQPNGSNSSQKRPRNEREESVSKRPKFTDPLPSTSVAESSTAPKRPTAHDHVPRPGPSVRVDRESSKQAAEKTLKKFKEKRKREADNPFIKRR